MASPLGQHKSNPASEPKTRGLASASRTNTFSQIRAIAAIIPSLVAECFPGVAAGPIRDRQRTAILILVLIVSGYSEQKFIAVDLNAKRIGADRQRRRLKLSVVAGRNGSGRG
jgi:hypothetical protein